MYSRSTLACCLSLTTLLLAACEGPSDQATSVTENPPPAPGESRSDDTEQPRLPPPGGAVAGESEKDNQPSDPPPKVTPQETDQSPPADNTPVENTKDAANEDQQNAAMQQLEGTWDIRWMNQKKVPDNEAGEMLFTFAGGELTMRNFGGDEGGIYTVDATQTPHHIDLTVIEGRNRVTLPAIYEILDNGNRMRICFALPQRGRGANGQPIPVPGKRPTEFHPKQGQLLTLMKMKSYGPPVLTVGREMPWVGDGTLAFSPVDDLIAVTIGGDILLWDLAKNVKVGRIDDPHEGSVSSLDFSPDGKRLASATGAFSKGATIWDVATLERLHEFPEASAFALFSPDGKLLATGGRYQHLQLWDSESGELKFTCETDEKSVWNAEFSPSGDMLAATTPADQFIRLWNPNTGELIATLEGKSDDKRGVAFHPEGRLLAVAASGSSPLEIWDVVDKKLVKAWPDGGGVYDVDFSADGKHVVSGHFQIKIRDHETGNLVTMVPMDRDEAGYVSTNYSPDGRMLAISGNHTTRVWPMTDTDLPSPTVWPPPLTEQQQRELEQLTRFQHFRMAHANAVQISRGVKNIVDKDGKPLLSWRVALLSYLERTDIVQAIKRDEPWDSEHNAPLAKEADRFFRMKGAESGTTVWQLATGPGTLYEKPNERATPTDGGNTIMIVQTAPEAAVPLLAPRDFVFNPDDPWDGLPKAGFPALFLSGHMRWVKGDTPPETLKALFTAAGGEEVDIDAVTTSIFGKFLRGPE